MARSKRPTFNDDVLAATGGEVKRFLPSHVRASHADNQRWAPYDTPAEIKQWIGDKCCFTLAQIEERLASLLKVGQLEDVTVTISNTGYPDLAIGFLRHCAFLLAEARGVLDDIPGAKGLKFAGIRAKVIQAPKTQSEHRDLARKNLEENRARKELSDVDLAFALKRSLASFDDDGKLPTRQQVAEEFGMSKRSVDRYLSILAAKPEQLLAVHEGRLKVSQLINEMKAKGQGNTRGANPGVQRQALRRRVTEKRPTKSLSPAQVDELVSVLIGDAEREKADKLVQEYVLWCDEPPTPKEPKKPRKKAPPAAGKKADS